MLYFERSCSEELAAQEVDTDAVKSLYEENQNHVGIQTMGQNSL